MARHRGMVAPINSIKHYVHFTNATLATNVVRSLVIVDAVVAPADSNSFDVTQGSIVKAVFIELWVLPTGTEGTTDQFQFMIEKVPSNQASVTNAQIVNLGSYTNKKNVLYHTQGVLGAFSGAQNAIPVFKAWIAIPKGKQRMGLSDRIVATVFTLGTSMQTCGFSTYKEYR